MNACYLVGFRFRVAVGGLRIARQTFKLALTH